MKKKLSNLIFVLLCLLCANSCGNGDYKEENRLTIEPRFMVDIDITRTISESKFVPLETSKESLVIYPDKVIQKGNNIYILDRRQKAILHFDVEGRFINKVKGISTPGPMEISEMIDISLCEPDTSIVVLGMFYVAKLSLDLVLIEKWNNRIGICHQFWLSKNDFLYHSNYFNPNNNSLVGIINATEKKEIRSIIRKDDQINMPFQQPDVFLKQELGPLVCLPFHDTVYKFVNDRLEVHKVIDYGRYKIPGKLKANLNPTRFLEIGSEQYAFCNTKYFENRQNIIFSYHYDGKFRSFVYSKRDRAGVTVNSFVIGDKKLNLRRVGASEQNELIVWFEPEVVNLFNKKGIVSQSIESLSEESNPTLCFISEIIQDES